MTRGKICECTENRLQRKGCNTTTVKEIADAEQDPKILTEIIANACQAALLGTSTCYSIEPLE